MAILTCEDLSTTGAGDKLLDAINENTASNFSKRLVLMGTSMMAQQTEALYFSENGSIPTALARCGWPLELTLDDNYAVGGSVSSEILNDQLPLVLESHKSNKIGFVACSIGGNDPRDGIDIETTKANILEIVNQLNKNGIRIVVELLNPWGKSTDVVQSKQANNHLNMFYKELALQGKLEYIDNTLTLLDTSTKWGNSLQELMNDSDSTNLHPNGAGALALSDAWVEYFSKYQPTVTTTHQFIDSYDEEFNPTGNILLNTTLEGSGTAPDGISSDGVWVRSDHALGSGQLVNEWTHSLTPNFYEKIQDFYNGGKGWVAGDRIQEGDKVYAIVKMKLVNVSGLRTLKARITSYNGELFHTREWGRDANQDNNTAMYKGGWSGEIIIKTPVVTVEPYEGTGDVSVYARVNFQTDSDASGEISYTSFEIRKVI